MELVKLEHPTRGFLEPDRLLPRSSPPYLHRPWCNGVSVANLKTACIALLSGLDVYA